MMSEPDNCEACGRDLTNWRPDIYGTPDSTGPGYDMRSIAAQNLRRHNEALEKLTQQMDELLELLRSQGLASQEIMERLAVVCQNLRPRHGLCIDRNCAMCRVQEEAIKEHVLVYIDWRVPGTVQKLQQARHRN